MDGITEQKSQNLESLQENLEPQLSPEITERVMAKVKDINEIGTAYTSLTAVVSSGRRDKPWEETLKGVFANGLLGTPEAQAKGTGVENKDIEKDQWVKNVRENKDARVYFNIVGRSNVDYSDTFMNMYHSSSPANLDKSYFQPQKIEKSNYFLPDRKDVIGLIFNSKSYHEKLLPEGQEEFEYPSGKEVSGKIHEYRAHQFPYGAVINGKPFPHTDLGFYLSFRVAPRFFEGIIFRRVKKSNNDEETDPIKIKTRVKEIAGLMLSEYKDRSNLIIPIYDVHGNLWWPKQMKYEEVKKLHSAKL